MFEENQEILARAEEVAQTGNVNHVLRELRKLCQWDFNYLLISLPDARWPNLSRVLPSMASADIQVSWTGASGPQLLGPTTDFVRMMSHHFIEITRRSLKDARVLDFGCGYGRMLRQMYYYTDPENIFAVDPWDKSCEICRNDRVLGTIMQSDYIPISLPIDRSDMELIFAYSVFTHISKKAAIATLTALRRHIAPSGLLILTTRPVEWWAHTEMAKQVGWNPGLQADAHRLDGFSFFPLNWNTAPGEESIFGHASLTAGWINDTFPFWRVEAYDRGIDQMQTVYVLSPK